MTRQPNFTDEEIELLRRVYPTYDHIEELQAAFPDRTVKSLRNAAVKREIRRTKITQYNRTTETAKPYSDEEIKKLRQIYPTYKDFHELLDAFPGRSFCALQARARMLGLRRPLRDGINKGLPIKSDRNDAELFDDQKDRDHIAAVKKASRHGGGFPWFNFKAGAMIWPMGKVA